jgi:hypothetical protein
MLKAFTRSVYMYRLFSLCIVVSTMHAHAIEYILVMARLVIANQAWSLQWTSRLRTLAVTTEFANTHFLLSYPTEVLGWKGQKCHEESRGIKICLLSHTSFRKVSSHFKRPCNLPKPPGITSTGAVYVQIYVRVYVRKCEMKAEASAGP